MFGDIFPCCYISSQVGVYFLGPLSYFHKLQFVVPKVYSVKFYHNMIPPYLRMNPVGDADKDKAGIKCF